MLKNNKDIIERYLKEKENLTNHFLSYPETDFKLILFDSNPGIIKFYF